jgi:hypothetical protein
VQGAAVLLPQAVRAIVLLIDELETAARTPIAAEPPATMSL